MKAKMKNGLYVVDHVSSHYKETTFPSIDQKNNNFNK
jgi:hypothetical protein